MSGIKSKTESSEEVLKDLVEMSMLFDFYGELLDEHKKEIFGSYVMDDLSLSEIAENVGISRQGVYDIIKRCSKQLKDYEDRLGLVKRFNILQNDAKELKKIALEATETQISAAITSVADDIIAQL